MQTWLSSLRKIRISCLELLLEGLSLLLLLELLSLLGYHQRLGLTLLLLALHSSPTVGVLHELSQELELLVVHSLLVERGILFLHHLPCSSNSPIETHAPIQELHEVEVGWSLLAHWKPSHHLAKTWGLGWLSSPIEAVGLRLHLFVEDCAFVQLGIRRTHRESLELWRLIY